MYVVIDLSGKQQRVEKNEIVRIEKINKSVGDEVEFDKIMMFQDDNGDIKVGAPYLENIKVKAKVLAQDRAKKVIVFKKKRRKSYTKTKGHRQYYTEIQIQDIVC
jgi:large subunit ribosomal protein L21